MVYKKEAKEGDLRVWWIPQVPMNPFFITVLSIEEGERLLDVLAAYDQFQLDNNIKPDYCNVGGIQRYEKDEDKLEWFDVDLEWERENA